MGSIFRIMLLSPLWEKSTHVEAMAMDDNPCRNYFCEPNHPYQRQYEALRAIFVEGRSQQEVAQAFGYTYDSLRQLVHQFRQHCQSSTPCEPSPFFESPSSEGPPSQGTPQ